MTRSHRHSEDGDRNTSLGRLFRRADAALPPDPFGDPPRSESRRSTGVPDAAWPQLPPN